MKKKWIRDAIHNGVKTKTWKIMRLSAFFLFLFLAQVWAESGYSQQTKLTLKMDNARVIDVLDEIENNSEFYFLFNQKLVDVERKVDVDVNEKTIDRILTEIFEGTDVYHQVNERVIVLTTEKITGKINDLKFQQIPVSGTVTDESGQPLPGVTVVVKGTTQGTVTNSEGAFSMSDIQENSILVFSFVGMQTQEIEVLTQTSINVKMQVDAIGIEEVIAVGYGTMKKSDLTGAVQRIDADNFKTQSMSQVTEMLSGRVSGLNITQATNAQGGGNLEIRGPTSLSAGTNPLIVLDGVIFDGNIRDINSFDIESVDILKDASSAAVFGSKAASGVIIITTTSGKTGKPVINVSTKIGLTDSYNQRRGLGPDEYIQFRIDWFKQSSPELNQYFFTKPEDLPATISLEQWLNLVPSPSNDPMEEWMARIQLFPIEKENYRAGKTMDMYDEVFRTGLRQEYNTSISGGSEKIKYYWSFGYKNNEGIVVGDQFASFQSRINTEIVVADWLSAGINAQFSDRDESSVPANWNGFYVNSPYGQMFDENNNLIRFPHGHSLNPLLNYYRTSLSNITNGLFANMYALFELPFGIKYKLSFQPFYQWNRNYRFTTISEKLGGFPNEESEGSRSESNTFNWMIDNLITWNKSFGDHKFDLTLLANIEENRLYSSVMKNKNFSPNQELIYHGLHFGDSPEIEVYDSKSNGDALMARLNYTFGNRYLLTTSIRRDGFSAFGIQNPRAVFPAVALGWIISEEDFFKAENISGLKIRASWGVNGNRDIGIYSALARTTSDLWFDGSNYRIGVLNSTLANDELKWERTAAFNLGIDISLIENKINISSNAYEMTTNDLLMNRLLPRVTGFRNITSNLGELKNRGFEIEVNTNNIDKPGLKWTSSFIFSFNRNEIVELFGDYRSYKLLNQERTGDVPDFTNQWFPGEAIDVIWDYKITGIWQTHEAEEATKFGSQPGDFKAEDVNGDFKYVDLEDKQFIGYSKPQYRLGFTNEVNFLKHFKASVFLRADLGFMRKYNDALNEGFLSNDRWNRHVGPVPYWTVDNPNDEYARLNVVTSMFGGGINIWKPSSFLRLQDFTLSYNLPAQVIKSFKINSVQIFGSARNLLTITNWPGWDPESGMNPMPRTFSIGVNCSL